MTEDEARRMAGAALPCPFCGERLTAEQDRHSYFVGHPRGGCFECAAILSAEDDLVAWNTRAGPVGKKWFLAYAYKTKYDRPAVTYFGSTVVGGGQHPVAKVAHWNRLHGDRVFVLLNYRELPGDFPHELDVEA